MIGEMFKLIGKIVGFSFGIVLIGVVVMWFGFIPLVACIFDEISGLIFFGFSVVMFTLVVLIVRWLKS